MKFTKTNKVIDDFNAKLTKEAKQNLSDNKASGDLYNSLKIVEDKVNGGFTISVEMEDYGFYVDEGRKPGKGIPVNDLKKWIVQKGLDKKDKSTRTAEQKINSLAYVINRKIREEGIKETNWLTEPLEDLFPKFAEDVTDAFGDDLIDFYVSDSE